MVVSPVMGDGWGAESSERVVGAVDGETDKPVSTFRPAVSHIEGGCACAEGPARKG